MEKKLAVIFIVSLLFSVVLFAQDAPKPVLQELYDFGGSYPDNVIYPEDGTIFFEVWTASRPQYIIDGPNPALGSLAYLSEGGRFVLMFDPANFRAVGSPVGWSIGDIIRIRVSQPSTGRWASAEFALESGSPQLRYRENAIALQNKPTLYPPRDLEAEFATGVVNLTWNAPNVPATLDNEDGSRAELLSYDVYRDHEKINKRPVFETTYVDENVSLDNVYLYYVKAVFMEGDSERSNIQIVDLVAVEEDIVAIPLVTGLKKNYPNPFNPDTNISFDIAEAGDVSIVIYNSRGQKVKSLLNEYVGVGSHTAHWDGRDDNNRPVSSGIYFYRMQKGSYNSSKKMIMMK
ncbi:MAG: T9SS type A sorting domain-containing protein [Candidatus Cloacimonas sp.]|nr:T9SS type A sorting domain-containing protein [Candidatus Cloacimonadota bacterium]